MHWLHRRLAPIQLMRNNIVLLVCLVILVLFFPIITAKRELLGDIIFSGIILASIFSLNFTEKTRKILMTTGGSTLGLIWLSFFLGHRVWVLLAFFNGVSLLVLGMLGEYLVRLLNEVTVGQPYYVRKVVGEND